MLGVSVLVIGIRLGLQFRKPHDNLVNANREFSLVKKVAPDALELFVLVFVLELHLFRGT